MAEIRVLSGRVAKSRVKGLLTLGLLIGVGYGTYIFGPKYVPRYIGKVRNQINVNVERIELQKLVFHDNYNGAIKRFRNISHDGFLTANTLKRERGYLYRLIAMRKIEHFGDRINTYDYIIARDMLEHFRHERFFKPEQIKQLERRLESISPEAIMNRSVDGPTSSVGIQSRINNYNMAENIYSKLGQTNNELTQMQVLARLALVENSFTVERGRIIMDLSGLEGYLRSHPDFRFPAGDNNVDNYLQNYRNTIANSMFEHDFSFTFAPDVFSRLSTVLDSLHVEGKQAVMRSFIDSYYTYCEKRVKDDRNNTGTDITLLDNLMSLNKTYSYGRQFGIVNLYVTASQKVNNPNVEKQFLFYALRYAEDLPLAQRNLIRINIADRYKVRAENNPSPIDEGILTLQAARGLYASAGVANVDGRVREIDTLISRRLSPQTPATNGQTTTRLVPNSGNSRAPHPNNPIQTVDPY